MTTPDLVVHCDMSGFAILLSGWSGSPEVPCGYDARAKLVGVLVFSGQIGGGHVRARFYFDMTLELLSADEIID